MVQVSVKKKIAFPFCRLVLNFSEDEAFEIILHLNLEMGKKQTGLKATL